MVHIADYNEMKDMEWLVTVMRELYPLPDSLPHFFVNVAVVSHTHLGYYIEDINRADRDSHLPHQRMSKRRQGVIWGKDPKHFQEDDSVLSLLKYIANRDIPLKSTSTTPLFDHENVQWLGHQSQDSWKALLEQSKFLLGVGHPLLGPSAIDALAAKCVFINPIYEKPLRDGAYTSQHPYAMNRIGEPYVCSVSLKNVTGVMNCIHRAFEMSEEIEWPRTLLEDFSKEKYRDRVAAIFQL